MEVPLGNGDSDPGSTWTGFRLVGDNLDKSIHPRDMWLSRQSTLLHYFNVYAVKDRINFCHLNSNATLIHLDLDTFMPSEEDHDILAKNFGSRQYPTSGTFVTFS